MTITISPKKITKEKKVLLNVAFQNRFNPAIQILKKTFLASMAMILIEVTHYQFLKKNLNQYQ